jgi:NADPH-dependent 2,4-dienoyl-CoA reductase/sulfur reductase-like enzyme
LTVQGASADRIHYLRGIDDVLALRRSLHGASRLVIVGGGFIGMEIAASAVQLGITVTVLEQAPSLMGRVLPAEIGEYMTARHRAKGVQILTGVKVLGFEDRQAGIAVHLEGGESIAADCAVVGIGAIPNSELAAGCGLATENGIVVDEFGRTEDPDIWAAGDVTSHFNPLLGQRVRLESWQNAQNQAIAVARNLIGKLAPYAEVPWLWTDQYDVNLQMAGLGGSWDEIVLRGVPESGKFTAFGLHDGRAAAAFAINQPREIRTARRMIAARMALDVGALRDPAVPLQSLLEEKV